jgi:hypothetical protein
MLNVVLGISSTLSEVKHFGLGGRKIYTAGRQVHIRGLQGFDERDSSVV